MHAYYADYPKKLVLICMVNRRLASQLTVCMCSFFFLSIYCIQNKIQLASGRVVEPMPVPQYL